VNNAAVSFNEIDTNSVEHAETVLRTNYYGTKLLTEALLPLLRRSPATSRILNISSQLGLLNVSAHMTHFLSDEVVFANNHNTVSDLPSQ
jgi:NAD(P)-dependent dehydrogenase (short-subunit alcohol dehydrogenase family)